MSYSLLALAIAPVVAIILFIYGKDKYEKEPLPLLMKCFLGGMLSIIPAIMLEKFGGSLGFGISGNSIDTMAYAFVVIGLSEELCKYVVVKKLVYYHPAFNEPFDGIVYCVMVSMGFAMLENILYVYEGGVQTAIVRMFTAVPAHATFACIMGFYMGKAKFESSDVSRVSFIGLSGAVLFHGTYDYFLFENNVQGIYSGAFISLTVAVSLSRRAIKIHQQNSPFKMT